MPPKKRKIEQITTDKEISSSPRGVYDNIARWITVECKGIEMVIAKPDSFEEFRQWARRFWEIPMQFDVSLNDPEKPAVGGRKVGSFGVLLSVYVTRENCVGSRPG